MIQTLYGVTVAETAAGSDAVRLQPVTRAPALTGFVYTYRTHGLFAARTIKGIAMTHFDWHSDPITNETVITASYRNTQNVRRFMTEACGPDFKFDREFMGWIKDGTSKTMGQVACEWLRRDGR